MSETQHPPAELRGNQALLAQAMNFQREGHLDEAAHLYRQVLAESPNNFNATQLLGVIALQQQDFYEAQRLLRRALDMAPHDTAVMANLGTSHMRVGDYEVALRLFKSALELQPESSMWHANLGTVLHNMRRFGDAIPSLRKAHALDPAAYGVCILLGACLVGIGELSEAVALFEAVTRAEPDNPEGWEQLALTFIALQQHDQALDSAATALMLNARSATALVAIGGAQFAVGNFSEAVAAYKRAVSIAAPSSDLFASYGSALISYGQHDEAVEQFARALELDDSQLSVRWAMTMAHLKPIYKSESDSAASRARFARGVLEAGAWFRQNCDDRESFRAVGVLQPFYIAYQPLNNRELLSQYGALCVSWMSTLAAVSGDGFVGRGASGRARRGTKLRIGVVSSHIQQHSVWTAITQGWVYNIDPERFEIHLFKLSVWSDQESSRARDSVVYFNDRPTDLNGWVTAILDQNLDVIIYPEIGMHALTLQLASMRLAPVQAAAWGHPETTGLATIDLYLSADGLEPPNAAMNYVEELVRLPNLGVYVKPLAPAITNPGLGSLNLSSSDRLLLCPGAPFKYAPMYDNIWVQIASQLRKRAFRWRSGGRLIFFRSRSAVMDCMFESRLRAVFEANCVDFDGCVSIIPTLERSRFFGLMHESALMLDTVGFSGFNTALQAIECALPVLAFEGQFMRGRLASAIMQRLGLPELVATTTDSFIEKALLLAADAGLRKKLRAAIIERREVLFYDLAPVRYLEQRLTEAVAKVRDNGRSCH